MRRRTGGAIAAVVIAGGALALPTAYADPPDRSETTADQAAFATTGGTVELPTGDRVTVLPDGTAKFDPAEGREDIGFLTVPTSDSDEIIIVPTDKVAELRAGLEDPRRYNVTRLLEAGVTDAADAPASAMDAREYDGLMPDAADAPATNVAARALDIVVRDRSGDAPGDNWLMWASIDGSRSGTVPIDDGAGRVSLKPGEYVIVSGFWNEATEDERGEMVLGMTAVTVGRAPNRLVIDAAAAQPVRAEVERGDAELVHAEVAIAADAEGLPLGLGNSVPARTDLFLLPEPDLPELDLGFIYQPVFTSPAGSADPYTYNLVLGEDGGFPDDTDYAIADDELAQVTTDLQDLGVAVPGATCDYGDFTDRRVGTGVCKVVPVDLPSTRTMLYTPGPDISWMHDVSGGLHDASTGEMLEGFGTFEADVVHEAGPSETTVVHGPISSGPASAIRYADGDSLMLAGTISHGNSDNGESLTLYGYSGSVSLRHEGELLGETEDPVNFEFPIADEPGRYSLTSTASHSGNAGLFATESTQSWRFDLGAMPDEPEDVALPIVAMGIDGAEGGWVDRDEPIEVNLQLLAGVNAFPVEASKMTFEVSYNDGRTWRRVNLDRDGGTATAELRTPSRAEFVSVRMTAVDTHGTKVSHTTIRSFGLD